MKKRTKRKKKKKSQTTYKNKILKLINHYEKMY